MRADWRFLSSKVARRILGLFVVCSLIPIVALSAVSFGLVSQQLGDQVRDRLHHAAKTSGMEILARLDTLEAELRMAGTLMRESATLAETVRPEKFLGRHFTALGWVESDGAVRTLFGLPITRPSLDDDQRRHLATGKALIVMDRDPALGGRNLPTLIAGLEDGTGLLIGRIHPGFLWAEPGEDATTDLTGLIVLDASFGVLHASTDPPRELPDAALRRIGETSIGDFVWNDGERNQLSSYWWLFLKPQYGYSHWTLVMNERQDQALAPVANFRKLLPLIVLLSFALVVLVSMVQIRRSMVPLDELRRGTRAIIDHDFGCRVDVQSRDEFEELAGSFNVMATRLGRQFKTLATLGDIDRAILSTLDRREIVRTVLARLPEIVSADCVAVTLVDPSTPGHAEIYVRIRISPDEVRQRAILLPAERGIFLEPQGEALRFGPETIPNHLSILSDLGMRSCVAQPVQTQGKLAGIVTLAYREDSASIDEDVVEAKRLATQVAVALSNANLIQQMEQLNRETLHTLARAIDAKSPWTSGHSERVTRMAVMLAEAMGLAEDQIDILQRGGLLHDIGKIGVPRSVLDKPGRLTDVEMEMMKDHVRIGARILEPISAYTGERLVVLYHHERYDGNGYPDGLAGEEIPLNARVLALADVYDALISERPYRAGWSREKVHRYIREESGKHFDPAVVAAFVRAFDTPAVLVDEPRESVG